MRFFEFDDYRSALQEYIDHLKNEGEPISYSSFADALGVQKTFISKVFKQQAHLSEDHIFLAIEKLTLNSEEENFLWLLFEHDRSGLEKRKKVLRGEISRIQEEQRQLKKHTQAEVLKAEEKIDFAEYYLNPINLVVHAHLGIPTFQKNPLLIAQALGISKNELEKSIDILKRSQLIHLDQQGQVHPLKQAIHLDVRSIYCKPHQGLLRNLCNERIMKVPPERRFVFNQTFSGSLEIKGKIQEKFLVFMKEVESLIKDDSTSDRVYQITFDLFPWTDKER